MDSKWTERIEDLSKRREDIIAAGGEARVAKQHSQGKLTARERMEALFDDDTFVELNDMVTSHAIDFGMDKKRKAGDGVITGYGKIHGRIVDCILSGVISDATGERSILPYMSCNINRSGQTGIIMTICPILVI